MRPNIARLRPTATASVSTADAAAPGAWASPRTAEERSRRKRSVMRGDPQNLGDPVAIRAAERQPRTVAQDHREISVERRLQLHDPVQPDDGRSMNASE